MVRNVLLIPGEEKSHGERYTSFARHYVQEIVDGRIVLLIAQNETYQREAERFVERMSSDLRIADPEDTLLTAGVIFTVGDNPQTLLERIQAIPGIRQSLALGTAYIGVGAGATIAGIGEQDYLGLLQAHLIRFPRIGRVVALSRDSPVPEIDQAANTLAQQSQYPVVAVQDGAVLIHKKSLGFASGGVWVYRKGEKKQFPESTGDHTLEKLLLRR